MNNKCFILYDGLISFILLISTITLFTAALTLVKNQQYYQKIKIEALDFFKNSLYYKYEHQEYLSINKENYFSVKENGKYCVKYQTSTGYEKYCE